MRYAREKRELADRLADSCERARERIGTLVIRRHPRRGRQLAENVRRELHRRFPAARTVRVSARGGTVKLRGTVPASQIDPILKCAWSIRGVQTLIHRLATEEGYRP